MTDIDQHFQYSPVISVAVNEKEEKTIIRNIYPNPIADHAVIRITTGANQTVIVYLSDMSGKICKTKSIQCHKGQNDLFIDELSSLQASTYLVKIITAKGYCTAKLVKYP